MAVSEITIGELSRRTGCKIDTIRYYEKIRILPKPQRRGKYRSYQDADVQRLSFVRRARGLGFPIDAVRALLRLEGSGSVSCADALALANDHLSDVKAKIAELRRMETALRQTVEACDAAGKVGCPLLEALGTA